MKAAVLHQYGENPKYTDSNEPTPNAEEILVKMVASSIKQIEKSKASGKHYTKYTDFPAIVGIDGIARLADGTHIYILGKSGTMAEKALTIPDHWVTVPEGLSIPLAAALPNALLGSDAALLYCGDIKKGDTIMIHGATGATGRVAIQMAKNRGAACVIALGRESSGLSKLSALGADILINTTQDDETFTTELNEILQLNQPDIVVDYLWGHPTELILKVMNKVIGKRVKFLTVGEMAGSTIHLPSSLLRSGKIELLGSGIGSISHKEIKQYLSVELPKAYQWAAEGKLTMPVQIMKLAEIETAWQTPEKKGHRIVVAIESPETR